MRELTGNVEIVLDRYRNAQQRARVVGLTVGVDAIRAREEVYLELGKPGLARRPIDTWGEKVSRMDCGERSDEPRKYLGRS